ncbi:MAG TPA: hypothetical protein DCF68_04190 [Cyanothece sp. UBA12306]|nr:hypothetical protein [Cyanothece sp. UBA12306]
MAKKFLLIAPSYACQTITGAGQRTNLIYQVLQSLGKVDILLIGAKTPPFWQKYFPQANLIYFAERGRSVFFLGQKFPFLLPELIDKLGTIFTRRISQYQPDADVSSLVTKLIENNNYNLIICRYLRTAAYSGLLKPSLLPVLLDLDDRDDQVLSSRLAVPNLNFLTRLVIAWHHQQMKSIMPQLLTNFQHIWVTNIKDYSMIPHGSVSILPNIPYQFSLKSQAKIELSNANNLTILFVGSFGHRVNREAMKRFIRYCWPRIKDTVRDANLRLVGSGQWKTLKVPINKRSGITIVGSVENLQEEYRRCQFTIAPIFEGGGTKIKVLESLFYGRTCLVTHHIQLGYEDLQCEDSLLVAHNEKELIYQCIRLLRDPILCEKLAIKGYNIIQKNYSFERFKSSLETPLSRFTKG